MNISKYCDFLLEEKVSKRTGKSYHCITIRFGDYCFPILFITKAKYDEMVATFNK